MWGVRDALNSCDMPESVTLTPPGVNLAVVLKPAPDEFHKKFLPYASAPLGLDVAPIQFPHKSLYHHMRADFEVIEPELQAVRTAAVALRIVYGDLQFLNNASLPVIPNGWCRVFYDDAALATCASRLIAAHERRLKKKKTPVDEFFDVGLGKPPPTWMINLLHGAAYVGHRNVVNVMLEAFRTMPGKATAHNHSYCRAINTAICAAIMFDEVIAPMVLVDTSRGHRVLESILSVFSMIIGHPTMSLFSDIDDSINHNPIEVICGTSARSLRKILHTATPDYFWYSTHPFTQYSQSVMRLLMNILLAGRDECIDYVVEWLHNIDPLLWKTQPWENDECAWASPLAFVFLIMMQSMSINLSDGSNVHELLQRSSPANIVTPPEDISYIPFEDILAMLTKHHEHTAASTEPPSSSLWFSRTIPVPWHLFQWFHRLIDREEPFTMHNVITDLVRRFNGVTGTLHFTVQCILQWRVNGTIGTDPNPYYLLMNRPFVKVRRPKFIGNVMNFWSENVPIPREALVYRTVFSPIHTTSSDVCDVAFWPLIEQLAEYTHGPTYGQWSRRKHWRLFRKYTTFVESVLLALRYVADANPAIELPPELVDIIIGLAVWAVDKSRWHCI